MFRNTVRALGKDNVKRGVVGYTIPESQVFVGMPPTITSTTELFGGKKVFLFAVPGAFTGGCNKQLPQYVAQSKDVKAKFGVDSVMCVATNDSFVMDAWAKANNVSDDAVTMLSDPGHSLRKHLGHSIDLPVLGGDRYARVAMVVDDGVITHVWKEKDGKSLEDTACEAVLSSDSAQAAKQEAPAAEKKE